MKKIFSILSGICFALMILPLALPFSPGGFDPLEAILSLNLYLPIIFGVAGIILGLLGMKGHLKLYLVLFNAFGLGLYVIITLIGIFGFREP